MGELHVLAIQIVSNLTFHSIDLATMDRKLESNTYNSLTEFLYDAKLIFDNCRAYNDSGSNCKSCSLMFQGSMDATFFRGCKLCLTVFSLFASQMSRMLISSKPISMSKLKCILIRMRYVHHRNSQFYPVQKPHFFSTRSLPSGPAPNSQSLLDSFSFVLGAPHFLLTSTWRFHKIRSRRPTIWRGGKLSLSQNGARLRLITVICFRLALCT